jgi:hypothetical protein
MVAPTISQHHSDISVCVCCKIEDHGGSLFTRWLNDFYFVCQNACYDKLHMNGMMQTSKKKTTQQAIAIFFIDDCQ